MMVQMYTFTRKHMARYTIKLNKSEIEELHWVISQGSHISQAVRAAYYY